MSFSISGSGPIGNDSAAFQDAFREFVRTIDELAPEGVTKATITLSGQEGDPSTGFNLTADQVRIEDSDEQRTADAAAAAEEAETT